MGLKIDSAKLAGLIEQDVKEMRMSSFVLGNYRMVAFLHKDELHITCGCRQGMTIEEARQHWSVGNQKKWTEKSEAWGEQRQRMISFLEAEAKALGWIK